MQFYVIKFLNMRKFYLILIYILFLFSFQKSNAQDLKINHIDHIPDTSLFSNSINSIVYFQFANTTLSAPFTVFFNYSVNGIVQAQPLDSFVYSSPITTEQTKNITIQTNSPIFRKGDNIVVVWPICNQITHTANYFRKVVFVTDSLHTSIRESNQSNSSNEWNIIFNQETKQLQVSNQENMDSPIQLNIYDISGKLIVSEKMNKSKSSSLEQLTAAIYIFELQSKHKTQRGRFLIY